MEFIGPAWLALAGLVIGVIVGFAVRRARLCTFGALEDAFVGSDTRRLRVLALAAGVAVAGTQALILGGLLDSAKTTYVAVALPWLGVLVGGTLFGFGMALVGTCAFGSLVRLGAGDLRSLIAMLVFGIAAYATLRGLLASVRIEFIESFAIAMPAPGRADIPGALEYLFGVDLRFWIALAVTGSLVLPALVDRRLRRAPRLMTGGLVLGLGVVAGWVATLMLPDEFVEASMPQSLTFVSPVARALYGVLFDRDALLEFGIGSVVGVALGSFLAARLGDEFRWEAFDDPHEMKRHLGGAALMGVGGVVCGGCTIGQGVTAGSVLALSWPIALVGLALGARVGIAVLMEGSTLQFARSMHWLPKASRTGRRLRLGTESKSGKQTSPTKPDDAMSVAVLARRRNDTRP